jgi:HSP20 family protein
MSKKKSFFERLVGGVRLSDEEEEKEAVIDRKNKNTLSSEFDLIEKEEEDGQLTVDLYQTPNEIVVQTMISGVQPDNLSIIITRDMITIKGKREENRSISEHNYFIKELFWGSFSRTISLPEEIDPEEATAVEKHGLLIIKLPKIDKDRQTNLKVKSV